MNREYEKQIAQVKAHLGKIGGKAGTLGDIPSAIRLVTGNYGNTGVERAANCQICKIEIGGLKGEWIVPANTDESRRGVYLHGGGWIGGSPDSHRSVVDAIATLTGWPMLVVDYRLAPEHPYPQGLDDCEAAVEYARSHGPNGKSDADHLTLMGDSAGGNLAAAAVLRIIGKQGRVPDSLVLMSAVFKVSGYSEPTRGVDDDICNAEGFGALSPIYLQAHDSINDATISPLNAQDSDIRKFPPTLIQTSSIEYLRDQAVSFAQALWNNDVPTHLSVQPSLPHVFQIFQEELAAARFATSEINHFLKCMAA